LRIDPTGRVGLGWNWPNPGYKLHVKGDVLLTTYPEVPAFPGDTFIELKMKLGNGQPGVEIGTNVDHIAFWAPECGLNKISVESVFQESDSSSKANMRKLSDPIQKIRLMNGYKYEMKKTSDQNMSTRYGLIAQEVGRVMPEATDTAKGVLVVDYSQVIPLLVEALKVELDRIEALEREIREMKDEVDECCGPRDGGLIAMHSANSSGAKLFQNRPNPFTERTVIEYELPMIDGMDAAIMIFDMNGTLLSSYKLTSKGRGALSVEGSQLSAGMYLYALVVDGVEVETKRMILTD